MSKPDDFRHIYAMPWQRENGPKKLVIDIYDDAYTPIDVMSAAVCFMLENPDVLEKFRKYIDDEDNPDMFTGAEAAEHLRVLLKVLVTIWQAPESSNVYVTGKYGWVN